MQEYLGFKGSVILFVGSMWMTLIGVAVGSTALGAATAGDAIYRALVAVGAIALAAFTFQTAMRMGQAHEEEERDLSQMVPLRVRAKR